MVAFPTSYPNIVAIKLFCKAAKICGNEFFNEGGSTFQHFSNSYTSKDEYYHCLTSDAAIMV